MKFLKRAFRTKRSQSLSTLVGIWSLLISSRLVESPSSEKTGLITSFQTRKCRTPSWPAKSSETFWCWNVSISLQSTTNFSYTSTLSPTRSQMRMLEIKIMLFQWQIFKPVRRLLLNLELSDVARLEHRSSPSSSKPKTSFTTSRSTYLQDSHSFSTLLKGSSASRYTSITPSWPLVVTSYLSCVFLVTVRRSSRTFEILLRSEYKTLKRLETQKISTLSSSSHAPPLVTLRLGWCWSLALSCGHRLT